MKLTTTQLRHIIRQEVSSAVSPRRRISEGHSRITEEEMAAWKNGDWGFESDQSGGHDHTEFLHGHESDHPSDDEGYMVKSRMSSMKKMAADICGLLDAEDQLPGWVQDLVATSHNDLQHVHDYLTGDVELRKYEETPSPSTLGESKRRRIRKTIK